MSQENVDIVRAKVSAHASFREALEAVGLSE
jgi:hypothetical protein